MSCRKITGVFQSIISLMILYFIFKLNDIKCNCEKILKGYVTMSLSWFVLLSGILLIFQSNLKNIIIYVNYIAVVCLIISLLSYIVELNTTNCNCS
jgi:hypothetical protein